jgi:hypothetical protein
MSVREAIIGNPRIGIATAGGLLLIGIVVICLEMRNPAPAAAPAQYYFTMDDGKTWFADAATNLPPYDKDGEQAVRAHVFRCPAGTKFVAYLERYTPDAKRTLEGTSSSAASEMSATQGAYEGGREVKRPGDKDWVSVTNGRALAQVVAFKCPDGTSSNDAVPVEP